MGAGGLDRFRSQDVCLDKGPLWPNYSKSSIFYLQIRNWSGNAGGAGAKPLLGSANTVQCQVRAGGAKPLIVSTNTVQCKVRWCGGEAPARLSKHCFVSGLG